MDAFESRHQVSGVMNRSDGLDGVSLHRWIRWGLMAALFWMVFRGEIIRVVRVWMHDASWSHGFLIPFAGGDRIPSQTAFREGKAESSPWRAL